MINSVFNTFLMNSYVIIIFFFYTVFEFLIRLFSEKNSFSNPLGSKSGRLDCFSLFLNAFGIDQVLANIIFLGAPVLLASASQSMRLHLFAAMPSYLKIILAIFAYDFLSYWRHRFFHSSKLFWIAHTYHHSATDLSAFTDFRNHPLQRLFSMIIVVIPLQIFFDFTLYESNYFIFLSTIFGIFSHGKIDTDLGWIGRNILVTPRYHHLHHAINRTTNKNFGDIFVFWDKIFHTYHPPNQSISKIETGITDNYFQTEPMILAFIKPVWFFYGRILERPLNLFSGYFSKKLG